jgi:hypothetical protein
VHRLIFYESCRTAESFLRFFLFFLLPFRLQSLICCFSVPFSLLYPTLYSLLFVLSCLVFLTFPCLFSILYFLLFALVLSLILIPIGSLPLCFHPYMALTILPFFLISLLPFSDLLLFTFRLRLIEVRTNFFQDCTNVHCRCPDSDILCPRGREMCHLNHVLPFCTKPKFFSLRFLAPYSIFRLKECVVYSLPLLYCTLNGDSFCTCPLPK